MNIFTQLLLVERFLSLSEEGGSAKGETRMLMKSCLLADLNGILVSVFTILFANFLKQ
jgi:hypothetical protein